MKNLITTSNFINMLLFQSLWLAAVIGSAKGYLWPCILLLLVLVSWQLSPKRRKDSDLRLFLVAIMMGFIVDTIWVQFGVMKFTNPMPLSQFAPIWILALWGGLALTVNHSMAWLKKHPLLPATMGIISAPLCYFGGLRLNAVDYLMSFWTVSLCLSLAWSIALTILVKISEPTDSKILTSEIS